MHPNDIRVYTASVIAVAVVAVSAREAIRIHRIERAKRQQIDADMHLDLAAIRRAGEVMHGRIERGGIRSLTQLAESFHTEIAFQKIAVRED